MKTEKILQIIVWCWLMLTAVAVGFGRFTGDITSGEFFIALMVWVNLGFHMLDRTYIDDRENSL